MLTTDVVWLVGPFLGMVECARVRQVCRSWKELVDSEATSQQFWQCCSCSAGGRAELRALVNRPHVVRSVRRVAFMFCPEAELVSSDLDHLAAFPRLEAVALNGCHGVTELGALVRAVPRLESLSLYWNPQLRDSALLSSLGPSSPPATAATAERLRWLSLSGLKHLTEGGLGKVLARMPNLVELDLTRVEGGVRDSVLVQIGATCRSLRVLRLYALNAYGDVGVCAVAAGCPRLQLLDLTGAAVGLTDRGVVAIARGCRGLQFLSLSWCSRIGDPSLEALGQNCDFLEHLSLFGNENVTDGGMEKLSRRCRRIRFMDLNGCVRVSRRTVVALLPWFPELRGLAKL